MSAQKPTMGKAANHEQDYAQLARVYDVLLEPFLHRLRARLATWMREQKIERALDIGCGTGKQISLAPEGTESVGIDLSHPMLRQANRNVPGRCVHGDATALPFDDAEFDLVYTQLALHEKETEVVDGLLREARRVLSPDGRLVVVDYTAAPYRGWFPKSAHRVISVIERIAGREHHANYRVWLERGGLDRVLSDAGWREETAYDFYGGTIKMGVYRRRQEDA